MNSTLAFDPIKGITKIELAQIEKETNLIIPENLKNFLVSYAGGKPTHDEQAYFYDIIDEDGWNSGDSIEAIYDASEIIEGYKILKPYLKETFDHFELDKTFVETEYLLPFILISCGGAIHMAIGGKHSGKVYQVDNGDFGILLISNSLEEFIKALYLYDFEKDERIN